MIKCLKSSEEHIACTFKLTELVQVGAEVLQWQKMFWLYWKFWENTAITAMEEGCDWPDSFKSS